MFKDVLIAVRKSLSFDFVDSISFLCFGNGNCFLLPAGSEDWRNSGKMLSKHQFFYRKKLVLLGEYNAAVSANLKNGRICLQETSCWSFC